MLVVLWFGTKLSLHNIIVIVGFDMTRRICRICFLVFKRFRDYQDVHDEELL